MLSYGMRRILVYGAIWLAVLFAVIWRREDDRPVGRVRWFLFIVTTLMFLTAVSEAGY